ncbi:DUF1127 domain-containing protein [Marinobacterium litorale]|jgi:hypothetical protein|uniref:DUF1127 domain-containing protein n=1 Tax=Marinobacterium litorale TaxID=404770 RepID=UPI000425946E|nr:DUF1127 domain-containing protein [Marinobacterium litorale]
MSTFDINANRIHHPANWEQKPKLDGLKALAAQIFPALNARITEWKYRRTLAALLDRDDSILEDIGMPRGALLTAIDLPLSQSARRALDQWQRERSITG